MRRAGGRIRSRREPLARRCLRPAAYSTSKSRPNAALSAVASLWYDARSAIGTPIRSAEAAPNRRLASRSRPRSKAMAASTLARSLGTAGAASSASATLRASRSASSIAPDAKSVRLKTIFAVRADSLKPTDSATSIASRASNAACDGEPERIATNASVPSTRLVPIRLPAARNSMSASSR